LRAHFESPGFITVDGSGALEKLIDILHSGDLAKEERRAIIARIEAETDLLKAQAAKQRIEALAGAVAALQSLNLSPDEILRLLQGDRFLVNLLGGPIGELAAAQTMGDLQKLSVDTAKT
jgi:hypothetical protein